jgi:hypothetical protein
MFAAHGSLSSGANGFFPENPAVTTQGWRERLANLQSLTPLQNRLEVTGPSRRGFSALEEGRVLRVKPTCTDRYANFLPASESSISFLRGGCGGGATNSG